MNYVIAPKEKSGIIHLTTIDGTPQCGGPVHYVPVDDPDLSEYNICSQCTGDWDNEERYIGLSEDIMDAVEDEWKNARDLAVELSSAPHPVRRRLKELHQNGRLNRRGGLRDTDGSKGYEYSQLETPKASYEENNNLFESMLNGD